MAQLQHVVNLDEAECTMTKEPKVWDKFLYDNSTNGGIIDALDQLYDLIQQTTNDLQTMKSKINKVINMYDICPVGDQLEKTISYMESNIDFMNNRCSKLNEQIVSSVTKLMEKDASFSEDLAMLNDILAQGDLSEEFASSATTGRVA